MKNKIIGIYKIVNCVNGKIYIGQSIDIKQRFSSHKSNAFNKDFNYPLYNALRKYGIANFEFIIIEEVISIQNLDEREQYWLDHYKAYDRKVGYNIRIICDSNRGLIHSEETKQLLSALGKGKIAWNKGIPHTEETRKQMSESHKGKIVSDETRHKKSNIMKQLYESGEFLGNTGNKHTKEFKDKIGKMSKDRWKNQEYKEYMRSIQKNKLVSDETREKLSKSLKGKPAWNKGIPCKEEQKEAVSKANKGKVHSEEARKNMSLGQKGRKHSEKTRLKMIESAKLRWQNKKLQESKILLLPKGAIANNNFINNEVINE